MYRYLYLFACLFGFGLPALLSKKYLPFSDLTLQPIHLAHSVAELSHKEWFSFYTILKNLSYLYSQTYYVLAPLVTLGLVLLYLRRSNLLFEGKKRAFIRQSAITFTRVLCLFALAFYVSSFHLAIIVSQQIPSDLTRKDLVITGTVVNLPKAKEGYSQFYFVIESLAEVKDESVLIRRNWGKGKKVRLSWRSYELVRTGGIKPGQKHQLLVRLKRPRGMVNEKGFDYQAWLLRKGVRATGYVKTYGKLSRNNAVSGDSFLKDNVSSKKSTLSPLSLSNTLVLLSKARFSIAQYLDGFSERYRYIAIFKALVIGDKSDVTSKQWTVFSNTGTIHLMAISGLHVGLVATAIFFVSSFLCKGMQAMFLGLPFRILRVLPSLSSIFFSATYALLAGMSIPTQRAMIVVILANIAVILGIKTSFFCILLLSAVLISALDPFSFMQPGFWLSFLAVAVLIYAFSARVKNLSWLSIFFITQIVVFLGLSIGLLSLNLPISGSSILANIVAVPIVSFVVLPCLFLFLIISLFSRSMAEMILSFSDTIFYVLMSFLENLSGWDLLIRLPSFTFYIILVVGGLGTVLLLSPKGLSFRYLGVLLFFSVFLNKKFDDNELKLSVLDVGQGLSLVASENNYHSDNHVLKKGESSTLVYDVGAKYSDNFDIGSRVVLPFLQSQGVDHIDSLVISHLDNDHAGGFEGLLSGVSVGQILSGQKVGLGQRLNKFKESGLTNDIRSQNLDVQACHSMLSRQLINDSGLAAQMQLDVLWPVLTPTDLSSTFGSGDTNYLGNLSKKNNYSCVVLINYAGRTILIMGDAESKVEKYLLKNNVLPKNIDILIAGHHGSNTSSTSAFVEHTHPKHVVFSAGYQNPYRHPSQRVVDRFVSIDAEVYTTGTDGQIDIQIDENGALTITRKRKEMNKRWY